MTKLLPALSIALGLGAAALLAGHPALASEKISQGDMPKYCQGKAAAMLGTRPNNVLTLPVERDGDKYIVPGQSPRDGSDVTTFQCRFNSRREFLKVVVTGTPQGGSQASGPGKPVAESEMAKYCQGEAAGLLNTRPVYILTLPVERDNGQYVVPGQSPPEGTQVTTFNCLFDGQRVFQRVVVTGRP
ncbi:MAG: hypothetical protein U1E53_28245 [Dongiaceae bacterium]